MKRTLLIVLPMLLSIGAIAQSCPNGDFENWNVYPYSLPDSGWYTSNPRSLAQADTLTVWPVTGYIGQAVHIQTAIIGTDTMQAYVINTLGDPKNGSGGVPYTQQPTAITGYYRYNMVGGDSSIMIIEFKKAGAVISATQFAFRNVSGSISTFTPFSFPLNSIPEAPDSVIIGISSSNVLGSGMRSGSWLEVDQLAFSGTGITEPIPGGTFDNWATDSVYSPAGWTPETNGNGTDGVSRSATHVAGDFSLRLTTQSTYGSEHNGQVVNCGVVTTGHVSPNSGPVGGLPYTLTTDTLSGYYLYSPAGVDTGMLFVSLSAAGAMVGGNGYMFHAASSWTYFEMPFTAFSTPDTMRIDIQSGSWYATTPGSVLNIDYLQLKSHPLPVLSVNSISKTHNVIAYPNPANDMLNIACNGCFTGPVHAGIYDITGRMILKRDYSQWPGVATFDVGGLPHGMYFYELISDGNTMRDKFIKE
jgi:Secretion system C-terminal sorting domain